MSHVFHQYAIYYFAVFPVWYHQFIRILFPQFSGLYHAMVDALVFLDAWIRTNRFAAVDQSLITFSPIN